MPKWEGRETGLLEGMRDRVGTWAVRIRHDSKTIAALEIINVFLHQCVYLLNQHCKFYDIKEAAYEILKVGNVMYLFFPYVSHLSYNSNSIIFILPIYLGRILSIFILSIK